MLAAFCGIYSEAPSITKSVSEDRQVFGFTGPPFATECFQNRFSRDSLVTCLSPADGSFCEVGLKKRLVPGVHRFC